jgi:chemotaxis signal transduction protein
MRPLATAPRHTDSLVRCRVAGRSYAFDGRDVRFIARSDQIAPGGDGAAHIGTLRGREPIPVFALGTLLHPADPAGEGAHVVVTTAGDDRIGWLVDRILRAPRENAPARLPLPVLAGSQARRWFSALLDEDDAEPTLVCSPAGLDPRTASSGARLPAAPPIPEGLPPNGAGRGVVALFSSAALPACGASRFAIAGSRIVAVAQSLPTRAVPGTPGHIAALAAWRGNAIPVLDLSGGVGVLFPSTATSCCTAPPTTTPVSPARMVRRMACSCLRSAVKRWLLSISIR